MAVAMMQTSGSCSSSSSGGGGGGLSFPVVKNNCYCSARASSQRRSPYFGLQSKFLGQTTVLSKQRDYGHRRRKALQIARAEATSSVAVPWEFESPIGQFLVSLLQSHPHLFSDAADQKIQQLAADKEAAAQKNNEIKTSGSSELVLYKRIAEVKEQECHKAIVEVIYSLVVHKFLAAGMSLVPKLPSVPSKKRVDNNWHFQEEDMISIHSAEVLEVVKDYLGIILGRSEAHQLEQHTLVEASKVKIGHLYAATAMFGYFLRRLDQRYQLDMSVSKSLPSGSGSEKESSAKTQGFSQELDFSTDAEGEMLAAEANAIAGSSSSAQSGFGMGIFPQMPWKPSKLKSYAKSLDQAGAKKLRCKESVDVVEKQTQALFGKPEAEIAPDGSILLLSGDTFTISLSGLRRLVLEAVAFGSLLWDVESYVDSHYNLTL